MQLESITYAQFTGEPEEWRVADFSFGDINLIVGKNATGKTRTLNIIKGLGDLVSGDSKLRFRSGDYKVTFAKGKKKIQYSLKYKSSEVLEESLYIDGDNKLKRGLGGEGEILAVADDKRMAFHAPPGELACVNRRDKIQHPFFEDLYRWGKNLRPYYFGTPLGKDNYVVFKKGEEEEELNLKNATQTVIIFKKGKKKFGDAFIDHIKTDMSRVGYGIEKITIGPPNTVTFKGPIESVHAILVDETDLRGTTDQHSISQGMFRALSLIIQINYSLMASLPSCILIDDVGEGLDYERSSSLIKLLIEKAKVSRVQLIMSTNDRFVMNNVPLEYWSVMERSANESRVYNIRNSEKRFRDFELSGLNNFDFFTSGAFEESRNRG